MNLIFILLSVFIPGSSLKLTQTDTIKIGLLVQDKQSFAARKGAELAIREANLKRTTGGKYYLLEVRDMEGPWGTGAKVAVDLVFNEHVLAVIGAVDGRNSHLAEQVSAKTTVPYISALSGDPTLGQAFIPWFFSCVPNDNQTVGLITDEIKKNEIRGLTVFSDIGYDSKMTASVLQKKYKTEFKRDADMHYYTNAASELPAFSEKIPKNNCIVFLGTTEDLLPLVESVNNSSGSYVIIAPYIIMSEQSPPDTKELRNVVVLNPGPFLYDRTDYFTSNYLKTYGRMPGPLSAFAWDAVNIIIESQMQSGTERSSFYKSIAKIRHSGATGEISFDQYGNRKKIPGLIKLNDLLIRIGD